MNIQYYGHSCFKITTKPSGRATEDLVFFIDPFDKSIGLRPPQGQADAVFITHEHHDHNNAEALKGSPIVVNTPGEYSIKGMNIVGIDSWHDDQNGMLRGHNCIYIFEAEEMKICHLGDLGTNLDSEQLEMIEGVDVLFVPIGGKYTIDSKKAVEIVRKIEPVIIIPMHYKTKESILDIDDEKKFCAEIGNCPAQKIPKLTFKKKDLENKNMEVVLMEIS